MRTQLTLLSPALFSLVFAAGCGGPGGYDLADDDATPEVAESTSALGEATCGGPYDTMAAPDVHMNHFFNEFLRPGGYNHPGCYKAFIYDVIDMDTSKGISVYVTDQDTIPTTRSACENLFLKAYFYRSNPGQHSFTLQGEQVARGVWFDLRPFVNRWGCMRPIITFDGLQPHYDYRIAATARPYESSGAPTRAIYTKTNPN